MPLKASSLKANPNKIKNLQKEISAILGRIYDEIKAEHEKDKNCAVCTVPITFAIPYMSNKNAQRYIYYKILEDLIENEFYVKIVLEEDKTEFHIKWLSEEEEKEIELHNALLAKHTIVRKKKKKGDL